MSSPSPSGESAGSVVGSTSAPSSSAGAIESAAVSGPTVWFTLLVAMMAVAISLLLAHCISRPLSKIMEIVGVKMQGRDAEQAAGEVVDTHVPALSSSVSSSASALPAPMPSAALSAPARSGESRGSTVSSASAPRTSSRISARAVESTTVSSSSAVPALSSAPVSSSTSALPALMPAASAAPSVTVEDESTKRCSVCGEDRPVSAFSSAQLKKKGKRVCHACVSKKETAAAAVLAAEKQQAALVRKAAMKDAFATRLNAAPTQVASTCCCCESISAVRFVPCIRCTVPCCSLRCFDQHDCDLCLEASHTLPSAVIPSEDQLSVDEIIESWNEMRSAVQAMLAREAASLFLQSSGGEHLPEDLERCDAMMRDRVAWTVVLRLYPARVSAPWWLHPGAIHREVIQGLSHMIFNLAGTTSELYSGLPLHRSSTPPCLMSGRLMHKLLTLLRWVVRAVDPEWIRREFMAVVSVDSDLFGMMPESDTEGGSRLQLLAYLQHRDPATGLCTLVPLTGFETLPFGPLNTGDVWQDLGERHLKIFTRCGQLSLDPGLYLEYDDDTTTPMSATTGWTGNPASAFTRAPHVSLWIDTERMKQRDIPWHQDIVKILAGFAEGDSQSLQTRTSPRMQRILKANPRFAEALKNVQAKDVQKTLLHYLQEDLDQMMAAVDAREDADYFHLIPAFKKLISEEQWPQKAGEILFVPVPQRGLESELVELSLLESLVEVAEAGDQQAQLLLSHIESECAAPIAEVIARQKSRLEQMLEDQVAQLQIHAEAVKRAELRGRLKGPTTESEGGVEGPAASASVSSSSVSALAPTSAASSSSSSVSTSRASSTLDAPAYSWTQSREYLGLESLREPGRKKYHTITSAALRFLYSLNPVSVNRSGGSHTVFHFASGKPVTLVTPHGGDGSVSRHATTRLYQSMHDAAMEQMGGSNSGAIAGAGPRRAIKGAGGH